MAIKEIKSILKDIIGLNANTVGASNFERAVRYRMKVCGISDIEEYHAELKSSEYEVKELIEEVVVPETWFFRNQQSFAALELYIKEEWLVHNREKRLKVLSVPSSTGEEPYSLAMCFDKYGLTSDNYKIDAIDISTRLLSKAKRAVYGKHSFRNKENDFIDAYFDRIDDTYVLHDDIRNSVNFTQGNLLEKNLGNGTTTLYDIIFCRNLLIYFDRNTQEQAIKNLCTRLKDDGIIFLGHAETGEFISGHLVRSKYARAFAYHKIGTAKADKKKQKTGLKNSFPIEEKNIKVSLKAAHTTAKKPANNKENIGNPLNFLDTVEMSAAAVNEELQDTKILRKVKKLADAGKIKEASALCEGYLQENSASAQAYYLLGLIRESEGRHKLVGELFPKAVYLDPNHHEAMIHLALHAGREGDAETAKKLHQRAKRVVKRTKPD